MKHIFIILISLLSVSAIHSQDMNVFGSGGTTQEITQRSFTDVCYVSIQNPHERQVLDLTLPGTGTGPFPLVIFIHGGAFVAGSKADVSRTAFNDAPSRGYALAAINYRLASAKDTIGRFPQGIQDILAAIRYLRANAEKYHLDPNRFAVAGFSSGAYHAAMIDVLSGAKNDIEDITLGNPGVSSAVQAAVTWSALTDILKLQEQQELNPDIKYWIPDHTVNSPEATYFGGQITLPVFAATLAESNPLNYLTLNTPPILMQHALNDNLVPWQQSRMLVDKINEVAGPGRAIFDTIPNGGHGGPPFSSASNADRIFRFLDEKLTGK